MVKNYLIIGASAAGIGCALRLRMLDATALITVLNAESSLPYNKCLMADVLLQEKSLDEIIFCNEALLAQKNIRLNCNARAVHIDPENKRVSCADGSVYAYDSLCVATGKSPRTLQLFEGKNFSNLFNFYYESDLESIVNYINCAKPSHALVIGGGLTGLEAADGLRAHGLTVTLVEAASQVLPTLVNQDAASVIHGIAQLAGVAIRTHEIITAYESHNNLLTTVSTQTGHTLQTDLVVCAVGALPNTDFLPKALTLQNGYCVVDENLKTSLDAVYAAGDCCLVYDRISKQMKPSSLWPDAMQQGMCAAYGMGGMIKPYPGCVPIAASAFFGIKVAVTGSVVVDKHQRTQEVQGENWYHRFTFEQTKLVGFMLIGNTGDLSEYRRQLLAQ